METAVSPTCHFFARFLYFQFHSKPDLALPSPEGAWLSAHELQTPRGASPPHSSGVPPSVVACSPDLLLRSLRSGASSAALNPKTWEAAAPPPATSRPRLRRVSCRSDCGQGSGPLSRLDPNAQPRGACGPGSEGRGHEQGAVRGLQGKRREEGGGLLPVPGGLQRDVGTPEGRVEGRGGEGRGRGLLGAFMMKGTLILRRPRETSRGLWFRQGRRRAGV